MSIPLTKRNNKYLIQLLNLNFWTILSRKKNKISINNSNKAQVKQKTFQLTQHMFTGLIIILEPSQLTVFSELFSRCNEYVCSPMKCSTPYLSSYLTAWSMEQCLMILWDGIPFTHTTRINGNQQKINRKKSYKKMKTRLAVSHTQKVQSIGHIGKCTKAKKI